MRYSPLTFSLCLLSLSLSPPPALAQPPTDNSPVLQVSVFNEAAVPASIVKSAESQASFIFEKAGVQIAWLDCPQGNSASPSLDRCAAANFPDHLHLHLLGASRGLNPATLGVSFLSSYGPGCCADVFYASTTALAVATGTPQPVILGHAMAHELGHLLLGTNSHSVQGLMRAHWDWENLQEAQRRELLFLPSEAAQIHSRVNNSGRQQVCIADSQKQAEVARAH